MANLLEQNDGESSFLLRPTNSIIVEIIKKELRGSWPSALSDLAGACYNSQKICQNILNIFQILSDEIFQPWKTIMTSEEIE